LTESIVGDAREALLVNVVDLHLAAAAAAVHAGVLAGRRRFDQLKEDGGQRGLELETYATLGRAKMVAQRLRIKPKIRLEPKIRGLGSPRSVSSGGLTRRRSPAGRFCWQRFRPWANGDRLSMRFRGVYRGSVCLLAALCVERPLRADPSTRPPEVGYNYSEIELPRTAALGGALRAFSNSTEALQINPANLAVARVYHVSGQAQFWTGSNRQSYGASVVDSVVSRSRLAGGVSANWLFQDPDGVDRSGLDVRVGLALPVSDRIFIGASGRYMELQQDGYARGRDVLPPSVASSGLEGEKIIKDITFDAGINVRPAEGLALALVGQNLTDPGHGFLPLTFGGGAGYGNDLFTVEADVVWDFTTYQETTLRGMGGAELLAGGRYPIRIGYRYDEGQSSHALSGGVGYVAREFSFDLSARRIFGEDVTVFFLGFKYHVDSAGKLGSYDD
jgi:hypothetical protein